MSVSVGDKVRYVPDEAHAMDIMEDGKRAWDFQSVGRRDEGKALSHPEVANLLKRGKGAAGKAPALKPLAPRCCWPAKVLAVKEDGTTVDLEVEGRPPGCTFGMANIPHAPREKNKPHTWHQVEG